MKKGQKMTEEQKEVLRRHNLGKKHSLESRKRMSNAHKINPARHWLGKKLSPETRKRMSESRKVEKHPNWKGGITPINQKIRQSLEYKLWRTAVFERDSYTCIWCGDNRGRNLNADHIKPFALYPELRFAIDNGRTLCAECHKRTDTWGRKSIFYINKTKEGI